MGELTLDQIHRGILKEMRTLEELVTDIQRAGQEAAKADARYKSAFSEARLNVRALYGHQKMTVDQTTDIATAGTDDEYTQFIITANFLTTCREALRASQSRLDGWRTLAVSFRNAGG